MKKLLNILLYICIIPSICQADNYLEQLASIVRNTSGKDWGGNKKWTLKYIENNIQYFTPIFFERNRYLSKLEEQKYKYISVTLFYNNAQISETYLILPDTCSDLPDNLFNWVVKCKVDVFSQLGFYAVNAAKHEVFTGGFKGTDPLSFQILRVFDGKKRYSSIFIGPAESLHGFKSSGETQVNFDAAYSFCVMVLYEYLNNQDSMLFKRIFPNDNFLGLHKRITSKQSK